MNVKSVPFYWISCRYFFSAQVLLAGRLSVELNDNVKHSLKEKFIKPRKHPGIIKSGTYELPVEIKNGMDIVIGDTPRKQLINESAYLTRMLHARQPPSEEQEIFRKKAQIRHEIEEEMAVNKENLFEEEANHYEKIIESKAQFVLKQKIYNWKPMDYSHHLGLVYMVARASALYAVMRRVFSEINKIDVDFEPKTLFDFGSGIGTVTWAAKALWEASLKEYYCVDTSVHMNEISAQLFEQYDAELKKKTFFRQFLPSSFERKYDLVVCSYSLLELPSQHSRLQTLANLWNKTERYLILVDYGTKAGFKLINEARDFLITGVRGERGENIHVLAPCPHDLECPRIRSDNTPCNFEVSYHPFPQKVGVKKELFSYIILEKGIRGEDNWPRIVRPVLLRSRHVICRVCTPQGNLQEVIFSPAKHGKLLYRCAKASKWGDTLPVEINYPDKDPEN